MRILSIRQGALVCFLVSLLSVATFSHAEENLVQFIGAAECEDCIASNIKSDHAFSGIRVTIECKGENGESAVKGEGELDEQGKFKVSLPYQYVKDDKLKGKCNTQLHSASGKQCATHDGLKVKTGDNKQIFELEENLKFSSGICASEFLWHHKHLPWPKLPPFPKYSHPKLHFPPLSHMHFPPIYKKPCPPKAPVYVQPIPPPVYKKPCPPKAPVYVKPIPPPVYKKPCPPKTPVYVKPPVPVYKPPTPVPVVPIHKPLPPIPKITIPPITKKPCPPLPKIIHKPLPPIPKITIPPITKKPCPPLPKLPPFPKIPPFHHHHKFGKYWPPMPPFAPIIHP